MNKPSFKLVPASLAIAAALLVSACASTGTQQLAAADGLSQSDAAAVHNRGQLQCSAPLHDDSLQAARCARAQLVRNLGLAAPTLSY